MISESLLSNVSLHILSPLIRCQKMGGERGGEGTGGETEGGRRGGGGGHTVKGNNFHHQVFQ